MDDFALTSAERVLFDALNRLRVPFIIVGMGAAVLEGAPIATQDLDVWFERVDDDRIKQAATNAGGFRISGFGQQPPSWQRTCRPRRDESWYGGDAGLVGVSSPPGRLRVLHPVFRRLLAIDPRAQ